MRVFTGLNLLFNTTMGYSVYRYLVEYLLDTRVVFQKVPNVQSGTH